MSTKRPRPAPASRFVRRCLLCEVAFDIDLTEMRESDVDSHTERLLDRLLTDHVREHLVDVEQPGGAS